MTGQQLPTIAQAISEYLAFTHSQYSSHTKSAYTQALHLFEYIIRTNYNINIKQTSIDSLTIDWAYTYLQHLQNTRSVETEHLYSRALLAFYQHVEKQDYIQDTDTLTTYIIKHRRPKQHTIPELPLDAIEIILSHASAITLTSPHDATSNDRDYLRLHRDKAFLLTLAHTGLRVSEICSLRKKHFNISAKTIQLPNENTLPIPIIAASAISQYLNNRKTLDEAQHLFNAKHLPIFARHDKKASKRVLQISRWTAANIVNYWVQQALSTDIQQQLQQQNCSISPQTFRHYFVITTLKQTGDISQAQTLARHADSATTRRYLKYAQQLPDQVIDD